MKTIVSFIARHTMAAAATVIAGLAMWTIVYFLLFIWAVAAGGGLGSPFSYPLGLIAIALVSLLSCAFLFLPATGFAEWLTAKLGWPIFFQIPISTAAMAFLLFVIGLGLALYQRSTLEPVSFLTNYGVVLALWMLPLGLYWWIAESIPMASKVVRRLLTFQVERT